VTLRSDKLTWQRILPGLRGFFWALFLIALPVTSFPYFPPIIGGDALVRPLSLYPLIALLCLATLPFLFTRQLPRTILTLVPFLIVAVASTLLPLLKGTETSLGVTLTDRLFRALITVGIGVAIYLTVSLFPNKKQDLNNSLRWLYLGFAITMLWGTVQSIYVINFHREYFQFINTIQKFFSTRKLLTNRISGLTYEPNWFAAQISFLLLPWLLASVLTDHTVFRWRWKRITVEAILLIWAATMVIFTFSRAGLISMLALAFIGLLLLRPINHKTQANKRQVLITWSRRFLEVGLIVAALIGLIFFIGTRNFFFSRLWNYWSEKKNPSLSNYLEYLGFGARFIYAETALRIYEDDPLTGIGLGNYAFQFYEKMPDRPLMLMPEVLKLVTPDADQDRLITPKNLYLRILAETGLVGMATFLAFVYAIFGCAVYLWLTPDPEFRFWGTAGLLGMLAFLIGATSFDSFAIPNMWVVFGLITAAAWVLHRSVRPAVMPAEAAGLEAGNKPGMVDQPIRS
jgi:O-antigen ligase